MMWFFIWRQLLMVLSATFAAAAAPAQSNTNQSTITIAFVGPYRYFSGLQFNGTLVTGGYERLNIASLSDRPFSNPFKSFYWVQAAAQMLVDGINASPNILPNTNIVIKRFDTVAAKTYVYNGGTVINTAVDIGENHKDVVAVFGELFGDYTRYSAQVYGSYQLPFCGATQTNPLLLNREIYPYYIQANAFMGSGETMALALFTWNVTRIAVISSSSIYSTASTCFPLLSALRARNIKIIAAISYAQGSMVDEIAQTLKSVDARYILICAGPAVTADIYFALAYDSSPKWVGPKFVWMAQNPPIPRSNEVAVSLWGSEYYKAAKGIIVVQPLYEYSSNMLTMMDYFMARLKGIQVPWIQKSFSFNEAVSLGMPAGFDCLGLLALGIDKILWNNSNVTEKQLASRQLQGYMNWTLFQESGYRGIQSDWTYLTDFGDLEANYVVGSVQGVADLTRIRWFGKTNRNSSVLLPYTNRTAAFGPNDDPFPPPDGPIYETVQIHRNSPTGRIFTAFAYTGFSLVFLLWSILILFRDKPVIRSASPPFLFCTTVGYLLSYFLNLLHFDIPTIHECKATIWIKGTAFSCVLGSLLVKNLRVCYIYQSRTILKKWKLKDVLWLILVAFIVCVEQIILLIWNSYTRVNVVQQRVSDNFVEYTCEIRGNLGFLVWGCNAILLIAFYAVTFASRNIKARHSEFTLLVVVSVLSTFGGAVLFAMSDGKRGSLMSHAVTIWIVTTIPLLIQLLPILAQLYVDLRSTPLSQLKFKGSRATSSGRKSGTPNIAGTKKDGINNNATLKRPGGTKKPVQVERLLETYASIVSIEHGFGFWTSEWWRGSILINKTAQKPYVLFIPSSDLDVYLPAMAFGSTCRIKPSTNDVRRLKIVFSQSTVIVDFLDEPALNAFVQALQ